MRLWVLTNEYEPDIIGGLGVVATNLTEFLARNLENVIVLTSTAGNQVCTEKKQTAQLIYFPCESDYHSKNKQKFRYRPVTTWLKLNGFSEPDLIHIHSVQFANVAGYYKKHYGIPVIYTCHSLVALEPNTSSRKKVVQRQEKLLLICDRIVVPSRWQKMKLEQLYPFCANKVEVIENGVDIPETTNHSGRDRLLFVGRLSWSKGIDELLRALAILAKINKDVTLDVVGTGSPGYQAKLKSLAHSVGIPSRVRWLGFRRPEQVRQLYRRYGAVIVPSRQESFGLVALEALANGIPLVSAASGGLADFVNSNVAEIIPGVKSTSIASAVRRMWGNTEITNQRVAQGRNVALRYKWPEIAARYRDLFSRFGKNEGGE